MSVATRTLSNRIARFAAFECKADLSHLSSHERSAIAKLVKAGKLFDQIYLRQAWSGNEALQKKLQEQGDHDLWLLFNMYKGPWVRKPADRTKDARALSAILLSGQRRRQCPLY